MGQKVDINLKNSLNTNTILEDIRAFQDAAAPALQNTGIERDGGITNLYETKEDYSVAGDHFITEDGNVLQSVVSGDQRLISVDGRQIGIASAYGVGSRQAFQGVDDACITNTGTILTAAVKGSGIEVIEYSATGAVLNSRTTTFANLAAVLQVFTSLSIVRYQGIKFADSLEFALRLGTQVIFLKEATPAQTVTASFKNTNVTGGVSGAGTPTIAIVYGKYLVLIGNNLVSSWDGSAWKRYDGVGGGTGPYSAGLGLVAYAAAVFTENGSEYLVIAGQSGRLCSYVNGGWNDYTKAGTGLWNNGTVIGANNITTLLSFTSAAGTRYLVAAGGGGRLGSYTTAGGWVVYTAGAGLRNNATLLGANQINAANHILSAGGESIVVVSGVGGRVGSMRFTGGAWNTKVYTDVSAADNPTNNATVCGANNITRAINWGANGIIFCSAAGTVGHWYAYAWYNYNGAGGAGVCINNAVAIGALSIDAACVFGSTFVISGSYRTASWDGANWKNYDGTGAGTGIYANDTFIAHNLITDEVVYNGQLVFAAQNATYDVVQVVTAAGVYDPFYNAGFGTVGNILAGSLGSASYVYAYRYENGQYLINHVGAGDTFGTTWVIDLAGLIATYSSAKYVVPQVSAGKTRHIATFKPSTFTSGGVHTYGLLGYTDFSAFSATLVLIPNPQITPTLKSGAYGLNYADITFSLAASPTYTQNSIPELNDPGAGYFKNYQSQSDTLLNAWGKLTNAKGVAPSIGVELRVGVINGVMAFLSAAVVDSTAAACMGVLLTNLGEYDATCMPDFQDDRILYRYNGQFFYIVLSKILTGNVFQKISEKAYKINTISPLNILSMIDQRLHVGSSDYHGQMIFESTAAPAATATNVASVLAGAITADPLAENIYSNSIDVGNKLCYITAPTSANISLVGYRIPFGYQSIQEMISTYIADVYAFSTANDGSELVLTDPNNPAYLEDTRLPVAIGLAYNNGTVNNGQSTLFLKPDYDGYEIGNEAKGVYVAFQLFGVTYLYDGVAIFQANFSNGIYGGKQEIAPAVGMTFIAATPNQAYFHSPFDNSVYVFNGGRSLAKFQRLTQLPAVLRGIFSTRDNTLLLETATSFIWVRDEIVTQNLKTAAQTALKLYDTTLGLIIGNDTSRWRYGYASLGGGSIVLPIIWQSSYYGQTSGQRSNLEQFFATIYSQAKAAQIITARVESFDEKAHYSQAVTFPVKPSDYSSAGYYRFRVKPGHQKTLGTSLVLTIPAKSVLSDVYLEFSDDAAAVVTGNATR